MQKIINFIKTHQWAYKLFYFVGTNCIRFLSLFVKIDKKTILFVSFGGKKFDDSPKALYDQIINDDFFKDYKLIWAFRNPEKFDIGERGKKIKIDTPKFIIYALKAKVWITNSGVERGLSFKKKLTIQVNTWHGTPLKKICQEENSADKGAFQTKGDSKIDIMTAQSGYDAEIFERLFNVERKNILECDLPRNDVFTKQTDKTEFRKKIGIEQDKIAILYAPTFREYQRDEQNQCVLDIPMDFENWQKTLGDNYVILFRAHYEVAKLLNASNFKNVIDVSDYPYLSDLIIASDMLVSDYSSMFFDYCITGKPMLCFAYDLETYAEKRGLYLDMHKSLPCNVCKNEQELLKNIQSLNIKEASEKTLEFKSIYAPNAGRASETVVAKLKETLSK